MLIDNTFKIGLLISLAAHGLSIAVLPNIKIFSLHKKFDKIEIVYIKPKSEPQFKKSEPIKNEAKSIPPPYLKREELVKKTMPEVNKPEIKILEQNAPAINMKISIPQASSKEIRNPEYMNYYQIIREKIKKAAYQMYTKQDSGEIYLSFAIASDGSLQGVRLLEGKSAQNQYLRELGLKSIQNASPFPPFPKELNYPQLSFNIIISFEAK